MLSLLRAVSKDLTRREIRHALIGAGAMAVHGVVRSTDDLDLLVTDRAVLVAESWAMLEPGGAVETRLGDDADPLAGVVRLSHPRSRSVDVVVGRHAWEASLIARAELHLIGSVSIPVASHADLILLKVYAGSRQDVRDAEELLDVGDRRSLEAAVEREIVRLPSEARELWRGMTRALGRGR